MASRHYRNAILKVMEIAPMPAPPTFSDNGLELLFEYDVAREDVIELFQEFPHLKAIAQNMEGGWEFRRDEMPELMS
jgi:hypothetical protein